MTWDDYNSDSGFANVCFCKIKYIANCHQEEDKHLFRPSSHIMLRRKARMLLKTIWWRILLDLNISSNVDHVSQASIYKTFGGTIVLVIDP